MIFITEDRSEKPLFYAYVNGITEKEFSNGGKITIYVLGTSEKKQDGTKVFSSWFTTLIGNARKECETQPLKKGDNIAVYGFKQTNISKKKEDGTFGNPFFNISISDYVLQNKMNNLSDDQAPEDNYAF